MANQLFILLKHKSKLTLVPEVYFYYSQSLENDKFISEIWLFLHLVYKGDRFGLTGNLIYVVDD
jgi:hypothetical protein